MKEELKTKIVAAMAEFFLNLQYIPSTKENEIAEKLYAAIAPELEAEAQKFAGWIANQVISGRTYSKLWDDYKKHSQK